MPCGAQAGLAQQQAVGGEDLKRPAGLSVVAEQVAGVRLGGKRYSPRPHAVRLLPPAPLHPASPWKPTG